MAIEAVELTRIAKLVTGRGLGMAPAIRNNGSPTIKLLLVRAIADIDDEEKPSRRELHGVITISLTSEGVANAIG